MAEPASALLDDLLGELGAKALLVVADFPQDPYLLPFVGRARLVRSILVAPRGAAPRLGIFTPMESREAARSGLRVMSAEDLDVQRWSRDAAPPERVLSNVLARAFHLCELAPGRVALAGLSDSGRVVSAARLLAADGWSFVAGEDVVELVRKHKSAADAEELRQAARGLEAAFRRVAATLAAAGSVGGELWIGGERLRVDRIYAEALRALSDHGLTHPGHAIVAPGDEGAVPHTHGNPERVLKAGESLVVDFFPQKRFFLDCTRTFWTGTPVPELLEAHALVMEALELARRLCRPGTRGWDVQEAVCEHFHLAGYATPITRPGATRGYVHGVGHGVGFGVHELPSFREHAGEREGTIEEGDVFALEPGIYDPDAGWAVRVEDTHYLAGEGIEVLTPLPYDPDPRAW